MVPIRGHVTVQRSRSLEGQIWCYSFLSLIIKHFGMFLALLHAGVTFRLTTLLSDFDKMTCLCMGGTYILETPCTLILGPFSLICTFCLIWAREECITKK